MENNKPKRKPEWLKVQSNIGKVNTQVMNLVRELNLHTVCTEAGCPNCGECFGRRTATFMILGNVCSRNCRFCNVAKGTPLPVDENEPEHVARAVRELGLRHAVITSVTRDDLPDGGARHFAAVISAIKNGHGQRPPVVEVLIPDFQGDAAALQTVIGAGPDIINHNVETVPRLYPSVRPMAIYERSLALLKRVKQAGAGIATKSGIMAGLGEGFDEVLEVFRDLRKNGCDLLTIGQYLAPSKLHHPVVEYVHPDVFVQYRERAEAQGFQYVASGPLVRSSYLAEKAYKSAMHAE